MKRLGFFFACILILSTMLYAGELKKINLPDGEICNFSLCQKGLLCMPSPIQENPNGKLGQGQNCKKSSDCASSFCRQVNPKGLKICEPIMKCFKPLSLGERCDHNPFCGNGKCEPYNLNSNGVGECAKVRDVCQANSDCCSNLCENKICKTNLICKQCSKLGQSASLTGKCCEGLVQTASGICASDMPRYVVPEI
jgi:hypothetical protein